jgi:phosphate:Na+ symporter
MSAIMSTHLTWLVLFGGISILIYGLGIAKENLQKVAGDSLRDFLAALKEDRFTSFATGFFMTLVLQSSSAAIAMVVGFAASSLITLTQAMALILGADVGTTITVQLIAFDIADYSLLLIIIGSLLSIFLRPVQKPFGHFVLGVGFIFLGMWQMSEAASQFKSSENLHLLIKLSAEYPFISMITAAIFTAVLQSSAASLGILLSLARSGWLPLSHALPLIIGANIGGCALPLLVSMRSNDRGQQAAISHLLLKTAGAFLFFPFLAHFEKIVLLSGNDICRQIANAHFIFNGILAILFLPTISFGARLIKKIFPLKPEPEAFRAKYLDPQVLSTPAFAFGQAKREVIRMAGIVQDMLEKTIIIFKQDAPQIIGEIEDLEDRTDILYKDIKNYLIEVSQQPISQDQAAQQLELIILISDLEHIADVVEKSIVPLAKVNLEKKLSFSKEGLQEITDFHKRVVQNFQLTISAFTNRDLALCHKVIRTKDQLLELELQLRERHLARLRQGVKETIDTSAIHLELLSFLRRINSFISNIAYPILQKEEKGAS